jgi:branched-chain amino acid transport system ATP-binding protein
MNPFSHPIAQNNPSEHLEWILEVDSLSKSFGGLQAVNNVSMVIQKNSLTALIGPNGAGKTTLFALLSGFIKPDHGKILFLGNDITHQQPFANAHLGLTRTFQIVQPFASQTVLQNICVGAFQVFNKKTQAMQWSMQVAEFLGLSQEVNKLASQLTLAKRKRLELARAYATKPQLLLLDEVLAGLNPNEIQEMIPIIQLLVQQGITVLMIEHVMQAVMSLASYIFVLEQGVLIAKGTPQEITKNPKVIEAYLGHGAASQFQQAHS